LLAGKALAAFTLGLAALGTTAVASTVLLDAEWGGLLPAAAIIAATVFAATAVIALVLTFARTEQQATLYTSLVTFAFAFLGGNLISLARAPELLRQLSLLTPNGWALRAIGDLSAGVGTRTALVPALVAICAFGLVAAVIAAARSDRLVRL
jgi:ABC-2 type transport system permease protein